MFTSVTFYAGWTPVEYDIVYKDIFYSETDNIYDGNSLHESLVSFTIETSGFVNMVIPTNGNLVFNGFYLDEGLTIKIELFEGTELIKYLDVNTNEVTIYMHWYPEGTDSYTITYTNSKDNESYQNAQSQIKSSTFVVAEESDWNLQTLPSFTKANEDSSYKYYFDGWLLNGVKVDKIDASLFNGGTTCELVANWVEKNSVTFKVKKYGSSDIIYQETLYYLSGTTSLNISSVYSKVDSGYVGVSRRSSNNSDFIISSTLNISNYAAKEEITITIHKLVKVTLNVQQTDLGKAYGTLTIKSGYAVVNNSLSTTEKINNIQETTKSIYVIEGTVVSVSAKLSNGIWDLGKDSKDIEITDEDREILLVSSSMGISGSITIN